MIKVYKYILTVFTAAGAFLSVAAQEQTDSTENKTTVLEEVVVEGRTRIITNEGMSIIPNKEDKKFSYDAYSLLYRLQIPYLNVNGESATTKTGDEVKFYIDYKPASSSDVLSLRTKDVLRVEYMEHPSDPRFGGSSNVVNFIMQQYEWGGYTSLMASQNFTMPRGTYNIASKFKTGGTTIDLYANGNFYTDPRISSTEKEFFNDINFNGVKYDQIEKISDSHGHSKIKGFTGDFKVTTNLNKEGSDYMFHGATIVYSRNPGSWSNSSIRYSPEITESTEATSLSNGSNISPNLYGFYAWLRGNNAYQVNWSGRYTFNKSNSFYSEKNFSDIVNNYREKAGSGFLVFNYNHTFSNGGMLTVTPVLTGDWYFTDYSGNYTSNQRLFKTEDLLLVAYQKRMSKVNFYARAGISFSSWRVNHDNSDSHWNPRFYTSIAWNPNSKHRASFELAWGNSSPSTALSNDVTMQTEPLKWIQGNPDLKVLDMATLILNYLYMPNSKFYLNAYYMGNGYFHCPQYNWLPAPEGLNGILRTLYPNGKYWKHQFSVDGNYSPISSLNFSASAGYVNEQYNGINRLSNDYFMCRFFARYNFKNFSFLANVASPVKYLNHYGFDIWKQPCWTYSINVSYVLNDFKVLLMASNFFSKRIKTQNYANSPYYSYNMDSFETGAKIALRLSYTFSYGKKIERTQTNIDETINSAVLK